MSQNPRMWELLQKLNNNKICSKVIKSSKRRNLWELPRFITNIE
ncbi:hypothetical protein LEP1GSC039_2100 [Leptospira santarosai str. 2000027870]|nr:hypothetical protein LEP1GSC039_2100 [Leptospira santarosai str. 2000027870]